MTVLGAGCGMGINALAAARPVGANGRVIAADVQPRMLDELKKRAAREGLADRIEVCQCDRDSIRVPAPVEFAIAILDGARDSG